MMNPCLRPACLSDWEDRTVERPITTAAGIMEMLSRSDNVRSLYDAEWRKRGFERSP